MSEPDYDFLSEDVPEEVLPEETPEATETETETVEKPPETQATAVTTPAAEEERVPLAALRSEREKRQKIEKELAELRAKPPKELPNFFEGPEAYVQEITSTVEQRASQRLYAALEEQARETYPDYDEVLTEVQEHAQANPSVIQDVFAKANPALAAYKLGKQLREYKAMQNPAEYRAKIAAEIRAEIEAENKAKEDAKRSAADAIPPELSAARASKDSDVVPDDSLDSILKSKR